MKKKNIKNGNCLVFFLVSEVQNFILSIPRYACYSFFQFCFFLLRRTNRPLLLLLLLISNYLFGPQSSNTYFQHNFTKFQIHRIFEFSTSVHHHRDFHVTKLMNSLHWTMMSPMLYFIPFLIASNGAGK